MMLFVPWLQRCVMVSCATFMCLWLVGGEVVRSDGLSTPAANRAAPRLVK